MAITVSPHESHTFSAIIMLPSFSAAAQEADSCFDKDAWDDIIFPWHPICENDYRRFISLKSSM